MLLLLLKLYVVQGLFVKYERAVKKNPIKYGMLHLKTVSLPMNMISCYSWLKQACSYWKSRAAATTDESKNVVEKSCL